MIKRPMKGVAVEHDDFQRIRFPTWGFPKIDGFRCVLQEYPHTSRLSRFPNAHLHNALSGVVPSPHILDGEVVVGKRRRGNVLQRTSSGVTSEHGTPDFTLWVFDAPGPGVFRKRYELAADLVASVDHDRIRLLRYQLLRNLEELKVYLDRMLALGYEGIVLRDPEGEYKEGKSTLRQQGMLKIKPFETAEGRIKGWFEEQENTNEAKREVTGKLKRSSSKKGKVAKGTLGGFILTDTKSGVEVRVGGGFTKEQRRLLWKLIQSNPKALLNELVTYKKQKVGEKDKPRHPGFVDFVTFRPEWDYTD